MTKTAQTQFAFLRAKSIDSEPMPASASLLGHLQAVHEAMLALVESFGSELLRAVGLEPDQWLSRLKRLGTLAAALHDVGKANDHFQRMIHKTAPKKVQGLRHEWVMYWLGTREPFESWGIQAAGSELDWAITLWAIAGHHPAYERPSPPTDKPDSSTDGELKVLSSHSEFRDILDWLWSITKTTRSLEPLAKQDVALKMAGLRNRVAFGEILQSTDSHKRLWEKCSPLEKRFVAVLKACLLAADVAGSYAGDKSTSSELPLDAIRKLVTDLHEHPEPHELEEIVSDRLDGQPERPFQTAVAASTHRVTFVKAGCGSGKTAAAYLWAARQCPGRRLYFCYPTTGTATEGFRDYLFDEADSRCKAAARLFHSRAEVDADLILHVDREGDPNDDPNERWQRADSLTAWKTPVVCCTVDRVLSLLQNQRQGLMAWPALAQSAFVFDEIHAYDNKLFGLLLRFIEVLPGIPVLLMTASLPEPRRRSLVAALRKLHPDVSEADLLTPITGPSDLEELPRYQRLDVADVDQLVREEVQRGGRVLWVCNTVDRAMSAADRVSDLTPMIYHSRFKYADRVEQHKAVVAAFKLATQSHGCVAISTQVAEMSLDLQAATLLVTDLCPVPSLIQRLGRLNRSARPPLPGCDPPSTRPFCIIEPLKDDGQFFEFPYCTKPDDYGDWPQQTSDWLNQLGDGPLSQADLANAWQSDNGSRPQQSEKCCWFDGGPSTTVDSVRDSSPGISVLLPGDGRRVKAGEVKLAEVVIPMPLPKWLTQQSKYWPRFKGVPEVPEGLLNYCPHRGAQWHRTSD